MMDHHHSFLAKECIREACYGIEQAATRPAVLYRPALRFWQWHDERGSYWTARYEDCCARGDSPEQAMEEFDKKWREKSNAGGNARVENPA